MAGVDFIWEVKYSVSSQASLQLLDVLVTSMLSTRLFKLQHGEIENVNSARSLTLCLRIYKWNA